MYLAALHEVAQMGDDAFGLRQPMAGPRDSGWADWHAEGHAGGRRGSYPNKVDEG